MKIIPIMGLASNPKSSITNRRDLGRIPKSNSVLNPQDNTEKSIAFNGLTKCFKNKIFIDGQKDIEGILKQHPNTNPVVGQLPNYFFKKLPKEGRREAILEILSVFDTISNTIREYVPTGDAFIFNKNLRYRPESLNKLLTDVLRKYKIIYSWDEVDIQYIDQGGKGKVFKLDGIRDPETEDEYVIKVFHQIKGANWHPFKSHGCYAEINNGIYWKNHEGMDTHRGKFFFASLGSGYIVSKFLDEDVPIPKRVVPEYRYGIKCTDEEKDGPINGYNRIKGYNYDYGGMRVVNRIKNSDKIARQTLEKIKSLKPEERMAYWADNITNRRNSDSVLAGLALGIKYLDNKNSCIDLCLEHKSPEINQALAYVLKYLPYEDAVHYFEKLAQTKDEVTQIILFNEIPLLAKQKHEGVEIKDDISASLGEIIPERIHDYYILAEKYAIPETIEHLASFVHLLPQDKILQQYTKLAHIKNEALQERLLWKMGFLSKEMQKYAIFKLSLKIDDPKLQERLLNGARSQDEKFYYEIKQILDERNNKKLEIK